MTRGDIVLVELEPVRGSEANERRPAVIVSHDALNTVVTRRRQGVLTVVPLSTNVARVWSFQVLLPAEITGLAQDSKAQAEQVRALAYEWIAPTRIASLPPLTSSGSMPHCACTWRSADPAGAVRTPSCS